MEVKLEKEKIEDWVASQVNNELPWDITQCRILVGNVSSQSRLSGFNFWGLHDLVQVT